MNRLLQNRLLLQLLFTSIAAVSVTTLSVILIAEAVRSAEGVVLKETDQILSTAASELRQQYLYRITDDSTWKSLPFAAKDISLRAITQTVLRSYPGVEGGFYARSNFLGYAFPTHDHADAKTDVPSAERNWIEQIAQRSLTTGSRTQQVFRGRSDTIVIAALADKSHPVSIWAMKRLAGRNDPGVQKRRLLLIALISAALFSIVGTLATGLSLQHGVGQINEGLLRLEKDFQFRLPARSDELGRVIQSINRMAVVRGRLETELRREDRLRAAGRLASSLAHEIRNPLNSIRLTVQLLEQRLKTNSIRPHDLAIVKGEVDRLNTLVTDLLDLQRTRQPRPECQLVLPVVEHCLQLLRKQAEVQGHTLELQTLQSDLSACFDAQQLTQTLVNLLLNAIQATPAQGRIQICIESQEEKVEIIVQDGGPGLSDEQLEHLFEPFYTTKSGGTGLGLAISRELMRSQEGDVIYRVHENGAKFVIQLSKEFHAERNRFSRRG